MKTAGLVDRRGQPRVSELARLSGVPESNIYRWLKNSAPDIDNLRRLINGFAAAPKPLRLDMVQLQYEAGLITEQEAKYTGRRGLPEVVKVDPVEEEIRALGLPAKQEAAILEARRSQRAELMELVERLREAGALAPKRDPRDVNTA